MRTSSCDDENRNLSLSNHLHDECGVIGVSGGDQPANMVYFGLYALQHRGQESCGIATSTIQDGVHQLAVHKDFGLVADIFSTKVLSQLHADRAIGHVRYATSESGRRENIQPLCFAVAGVEGALAHNGNITNAQTLRQQLEARGSVFTTTSDTEVVVRLMAESRSSTCKEIIVDAVRQLTGGFSLVFLIDGILYAVRDRHGLRPLVLGQTNNVYVVASETCALDLLECTFLRDVQPGELICIDPQGQLNSHQALPQATMAYCAFEPIYFSRPDSECGGESVYEIRKRIGAVLASLYPVDADAVIAVPDSATPIAMGYSQAAGIPLELGMIRNHYIGRTFIQPSQAQRDLGVKLKFNAQARVLSGRDCVVIDDSIVRGTTSRQIIRMLRKAGARKIHFRVGSPPVTHSCHYGISTPDRRHLVAAQLDVARICEELDVDSLGYLTRHGLATALGGTEFQRATHKSPPQPTATAMSYCMACFSGDYPVKIDDPVAYETHPTDHKGCGYYAQRSRN